MIKRAFKVKIPEHIQQDLDMINAVAEDLQMKLFVVGGFARDIVSGKGLTDETDLDVTEALGNGFDLAFFVAAKYDLPEPQIYDNSGTAMVVMPSGRMVEFHNAYHNVPHIIDQLYAIGAEPTPLNKDIYSRDFTINTLMFDPEKQEIIDITGNGIEDIQNKVLRTPLDPIKTLQINPKIILRGIRFKVEMGLTEDPAYTEAVPKFVPWLIDFLKNNPDSKMVSRTVKKTYEADPSQARQEFQQIGIYDYLPKTGEEDKAIKEDLFGTTVTPQGFDTGKIIMKELSSTKTIVTAQTSMIRHLMEERDKHKEYIKRKRREEKENRAKEVDILDRAKSGWYMENGEDPNALNKKKKKYMGIPGREYIPKKRR